MIADHETNVIFVADTLKRRFPDVYQGLSSILGGHGIPLRTIPGAKQVWCRDYMPIQVGEGRFVQFRYSPDYLGGRYRHLRTDGEIGPTLAVARDCERAEIVLDGGNVVGGRGKAIVCDKVFAENPGWKPSELLRRLGDLLEVEQVIVIPTEPGDVVGHSDGVVRFIDEDVVFANDYRNVDGRYRARLMRVLRRAGLEVVELPYRPEVGTAWGIPPASGCYVNYLRVGRLIVLPHFRLPEDEMAWRRVEDGFPDFDVRRLDCCDLSAEGGVLNCATWTVLNPESIEEECPGRKANPEPSFIG